MPKENEQLPHRGLYPTVAVSDLYNGVCFALAARACLSTAESDQARSAGRGLSLLLAGCGLGLVAVASFVGVLRFGFSERWFRPGLLTQCVCGGGGTAGPPPLGLATPTQFPLNVRQI
jgi:hypothetical protein